MSTSRASAPSAASAFDPFRQPQGAIVLDTSRFPLVVMEFPERITLFDQRTMFDACNVLANEGRRFAYVIDMSRISPFFSTPAMRKEAATMYCENLAQRCAVTIAEARVIPNPIVRGIATAFDWIVGTSWPTATFATRREAEEWAMERIRSDGAPSGTRRIRPRLSP